MGAYDPWVIVNLDPIGTCVWLAQFMLVITRHCHYIKYISYEPHGFREGTFSYFPHYKSMRATDPWGLASLDPRGLIGLFVLLLYVPSQQLWSWPEGQFT